MESKINIVVKISAAALVRVGEIDYNTIGKVARVLEPGMILVSSGAVALGEVDYNNRQSEAVVLDSETKRTDYSAQGQVSLITEYRRHVKEAYSVRQLLVEKEHFQDVSRANHIKNFLFRCVLQKAIPIVNYNDCVSSYETIKMDEGILDNDETACEIAALVTPQYLVFLTANDGIFLDATRANDIIPNIRGNRDEVLACLRKYMDISEMYVSESTKSAKTRLHYFIKLIEKTCVDGKKLSIIVANANNSISEIINNSSIRCTRIEVKNS